jgi:hypothetical protein
MSAPVLMLVSIALVLQSADASVRIGVAVAAGDGQVCASLPGSALVAGATLTLIQPNDPQSVVYAIVVRPAPACERLERALVPGPYYVVQPPSTTATDAFAPWVALSGKLSTRRVTSGAIAARLSPDHPAVRVRSCTSREGVHLTAWSGAPLTSRRLWHQYYYLGYDVEPTCDDREAGKNR